MPGRILLRTTPDGSQAPVDAVKIDSAQNVTVSAGNLVIGTSGKGIDFSATPGTGTSELLADYEEGTFTPEIAFGGLTPTLGSSAYVKVGNVVTVTFDVTWPGNADGNDAGLYLPYASKSGLLGNGFVGFCNFGSAVNIMNNAGSNAFYLANASTGGRITNALFSGKRIVATATYITA
jgi:hypothetical protein